MIHQFRKSNELNTLIARRSNRVCEHRSLSYLRTVVSSTSLAAGMMRVRASQSASWLRLTTIHFGLNLDFIYGLYSSAW